MLITALLYLFCRCACAQEPAPEPTTPPGPSPTRQCADAATGTEVEVCLQLAAEHPAQVDDIAAALRAHIDRAGDADRALLVQTLALVSEDTAPDAARALGDLDDPRAVPVLVACAERRSLAVGVPCVEALAPYREGLDQLMRWLRDEEMALERRIAAARTLGEVDSEIAANALVDTLRRPGLPADLRQVMMDTVHSAYPHRVSDLDGAVATDGRTWLLLGGGWGLGYAMATAGHFGQTDLTQLGWVTGAIGGGTAGYMYGRAWPMEAGDASYLATSGFQGNVSGVLIGASLDDGSGDLTHIGGITGLALGAGLSIPTRNAHPGTGHDSLEALTVGTLGGVTGWGLGTQLAVEGQERSTALAAAGAGHAVGAVVGQLTAPGVDLSRADAGLMALGGGYGLAAGTLLSAGNDNTLEPVLFGAGALAAYGLARPLDVPADVQVAAWGGGLYGGVFGAGLGTLIDPNPQVVQGVALGGVTAGMAVGAFGAFNDPDPLDKRDLTLVGMSTGWAVWQSAGLAALSDAEEGQAGWFLMAPPAVGAVVAAATPVLDVPVPHAAAATSMGLWGGYAGGVIGELQGNDPLLYSLVGSDIGLVGGGLILSPAVAAPPLVIGLADAGGVVVGSTAALGASVAGAQPDTVLRASLVGAGVGMLGGGAVGLAWKRGGTRDMAWTRPTEAQVAVLPWQTVVAGTPFAGARLVVDQW